MGPVYRAIIRFPLVPLHPASGWTGIAFLILNFEEIIGSGKWKAE